MWMTQKRKTAAERQFSKRQKKIYLSYYNRKERVCQVKLGSLFDGIGGFPFSAQKHDITSIWASEIEPAPVNITKKQFPTMKHLGNIINISGADIEPVDIITFGSPCQDLSVAGKQAGLDGDRSGLFKEAARIIKEMREATNGRYPAYAIWENVPGAFSSHKGEDFRRVLEALAESEIPIPKSGKWGGAADWSEYQTVKSLGELSTPSIGESPSVENASTLSAILEANAPKKYYLSAKACLGILRRAEKRGKQLPPLLEAVLRKQAEEVESPPELSNVFEMTHADEVIRKTDEDVCPTLQARMGTGGNQIPLVVDAPAYCIAGNIVDRSDTAGANGIGVKEGCSYTLNTVDRCAVAYAIGNGQADNSGLHDLVGALNCMHDQQAVMYASVTGPICARDYKGVGNEYVHENKLFVEKHGISAVRKIAQFFRWIVRRLTPRECERLQGFPDDWTRYGADGKEIKDAPRYKALGNSIAIPCAERVFKGIVEFERTKNEQNRNNLPARP